MTYVVCTGTCVSICWRIHRWHPHGLCWCRGSWCLWCLLKILCCGSLVTVFFSVIHLILACISQIYDFNFVLFLDWLVKKHSLPRIFTFITKTMRSCSWLKNKEDPSNEVKNNVHKVPYQVMKTTEARQGTNRSPCGSSSCGIKSIILHGGLDPNVWFPCRPYRQYQLSSFRGDLQEHW